MINTSDVPSREIGALPSTQGTTVSPPPPKPGFIARLCLTFLRRRGIVCEELLNLRAQLEENKKERWAILKTAMDGYWFLDMQGHFLEVNDAYCQMSGYTREELLTMKIQDVEAIESPEAVLSHATKIKELGEDRFESRHRRKDGTFFDVEVCVQYRPSQNEMVASLRDITERKRSAEALAKSEMRYRTLFDASADAIMLQDERGFVDCNKATLEIFQCPSKEEFCKLHPSDLSPPRQPCGTNSRELADRYLAAAETDVVRFEWMSRRWNIEELFPSEVWLCPVVIEGRMLVQAIVRDISRQKEFEQTLRAAKESAELASRAKDEFLSMMSHELRTPLNGILGFADLLCAEPLPGDQMDLAQTIRTCGRQLLVVINDVLDFSQIESKQLTLTPQILDPAALLKEVINTLEPVGTAKGIALTLEMDPAFPSSVRADGLRLRQILSNLIGNAIKFTEKGGVFVRATSHQENPQNPLTELQFEIQDTGIGVNENTVPKLFEPFSQADNSVHRRYGGTGLGLSISQKLCGLMKGHIHVKSRPNQGSTFTCTVHVDRFDQAAPDHAQDNTAAPRPPKILLLDDTPESLALMQIVAQKAGFTTVCLDNGSDALQHIREEPFDLILMDVLMPEINGMETTRRIREIERDHARTPTPIIAVTSLLQQEDAERCLAAGMNDYLSKPLDINLLKSKMLHWVRARP